jgi:hypothetical protein
MPDEPGISFSLPSSRFTLLAFKLIFFNLTEHFNYRTQASNVFQQLSLSSFVIINMGHQDRLPAQLHSPIQLSCEDAELGLALDSFNL